MIGMLTGRFIGTTPEGAALVDVSGVGYVVRLPATLGSASLGERVTFYIHTAVRDDAIDLYGFLSEGELVFFKQLMSVSGVGPKTALSIMGVADVPSLQRAIGQGDVKALVSVYGIGKKSAERLVVELRDKVKVQPVVGGGAHDDSEVVEALMGLGYSALESRKALKEVAGGVVGTRERLAAALRQLAGAA